ncbi:glutamate--tRNA ligase [Candidatus Bathyarchaeota archaeon]|nr:glutamate--tRNA ligase [Candidatus Bathyarchaeota archaeon]
MDKIKESAIKYALFNAIQYNGKANIGSVIGRIFAEFTDAKLNAKEIQKIVIEVVTEVNSWSNEKQKEEIKKWPELVEIKKVEEKKTLPPLKNVKKDVMVKTRFAPNPDGPLHMGSAEPIIFCDEYAKMYDGHFILRFEDTSADVKPPIIEMYDKIINDLEWLRVKIDEKYIQSDRLEIYYKYAVELIKKGAAYICICPSELFKSLYMAKKPCPCRNLSPNEQLKRWEDMLNGTYKKGDAVVRIKTNIEHPNPAIRDWPALRISTRSHPRVKRKYRVWPLYNFSCAIDDHLMKVTHIIRGKEHEVNGTRQKWIYDYMNWEYPEIINIGRLGIEAGILSKSKIRAGVENGTFTGWDDPRLGTLCALRKRGIQPETIRDIMIQVGPKPINATLSWGNIAAANKKIVEPKANRYFFVNNPVEIKVTGLPNILTAKLALHPDHPDRGYREYIIKSIKGETNVIVPRKDLEENIGKLARLMGLMNLIIEQEEGKFIAKFNSKEHQVAREKGANFLHWVIPDKSEEAYVVMPDATKSFGRVESLCTKLNVDNIIQFERFGFVRVDSLTPLIYYYAHN